MATSKAAAAKLEAVSSNDSTDDKPPEVAAPEPGNKLEAATGEVLEAEEGVRYVTWHDLTLKVPKEIPPVLMFDFVSMENEQGAFALMRMFLTLLDQEQFVLVRNEIGKLQPDAQVEAITELSELIMENYGTTEGESEASSDS
jgi:hypothetical protein